MKYELPWNDELMKFVTEYQTAPYISTKESNVLREGLCLGVYGYIEYYKDGGNRPMGSNCGVRTFGNISRYRCPNVPQEMRLRIFGMIRWLPFCTNPKNYPYAKFTSMQPEMLSWITGLEGKLALDALKKYGWRGRRIVACAHPWPEDHSLYYLWSFLDKEDLYALRGIRAPKTAREDELVKFREWINNITPNNKITWTGAAD